MNEIDVGAIVTKLVIVNPCVWIPAPLMNRTKSPVTGSYVASVGVKLDPPTTETAFVSALANTCS